MAPPPATGAVPPGPRSWFPFANAPVFRRDPLAYLTGLAAKYGPACAFAVGSRRFYFFTDPAAVRDVLVTHHQAMRKSAFLQRAKRLLGEGLLTSEGAYHQRQRRLVTPAFHRARLAGYADVMSAAAAERAADPRWRDGATLDLAAEMMGLTLVIVGQTLFGTDLRGDAAGFGASADQIMRGFRRLVGPWAPVYDRLPFLPGTRALRRAQASLEATVAGMVRAHRARHGPDGEMVDQGDLLSMLLLVRDEDGGPGLDDVQVRDEALTILLAGHETTANALSWTFFLLARHPATEARLHAALDAVLPGRRLPTLADLPRLGFVEQIVRESLRLYPPAWLVAREATAPVRVDGWDVPAGATCILSAYVTQRDARFFPEPGRFDPDRWRPPGAEGNGAAAPPASAPPPKHSYFPFGAGPRQCAGEAFAWMEATLLLAVLAQRWQFRLAPGGPPVTPFPGVTLRLRHGLRVRLTAR